MSKTLVVNCQGATSWDYRDNLAIGKTRDANSLANNIELTTGTGDGKANRKYDVELTLEPQEVVLLDLAGGLVDRFGEPLSFKNIKVFQVVNRGTANGYGGYDLYAEHAVRVGGASAFAVASLFSGAVDASLVVPAGGDFCLKSPNEGFIVTEGTGDILQFESQASPASGYSIIVDVLLVGEVDWTSDYPSRLHVTRTVASPVIDQWAEINTTYNDRLVYRIADVTWTVEWFLWWNGTKWWVGPTIGTEAGWYDNAGTPADDPWDVVNWQPSDGGYTGTLTVSLT